MSNIFDELEEEKESRTNEAESKRQNIRKLYNRGQSSQTSVARGLLSLLPSLLKLSIFIGAFIFVANSIRGSIDNGAMFLIIAFVITLLLLSEVAG